MNDLSERVKELASLVAEHQEMISYFRSLHDVASDEVIGLRERVRDLEAKVRTLENGLCCIQHIDSGVSQ